MGSASHRFVFFFVLTDYQVEVKTADKFLASTDARVKIKVKGTQGELSERELKGHFERGE